ncbi:MAG: hypothetical protein H7A42_07520 [Chlamydiales bacterium]|nr:hypothetical protein [Chlamydiales bacterium]
MIACIHVRRLLIKALDHMPISKPFSRFGIFNHLFSHRSVYSLFTKHNSWEPGHTPRCALSAIRFRTMVTDFPLALPMTLAVKENNVKLDNLSLDFWFCPGISSSSANTRIAKLTGLLVSWKMA